MIFYFGTNFINFQLVDSQHENNGMRISHRYTSDTKFLSGNGQRLIDYFGKFGNHRNGLRRKSGFSHIYAYAFDGIGLRINKKLKVFYTCLGIQSNLPFFCQSSFIKIFCHTTRGIAAHFGFAAVGIEHAHGKITFG